MDIQLDLFNTPKNELSALWESLEALKLSHNKVRKRLFAEIGSLRKQLVDVRAENERLKFHTEAKPLIKWIA